MSPPLVTINKWERAVEFRLGPELVRLWRVGVALLTNLVLFLLMLALTHVSEYVFSHFLGEPLLFGRFPLRYVFDALDGAILFIFAISAISTMVSIFRDPKVADQKS